MRTPSLPGKSTVLLLLLALAAAQAACRRNDAVLVLAAASTIDAMEAALADYATVAPVRIDVSFASSSVLGRQIEEGAPADILLAASTAWADYVERRVAVARREVLVRNQLTVVVPVQSAVASLLLPEVARDERLGRIAIADPTSVPAGIYAAQALRQTSLWQSVQPRLLPAVDVRAALSLVADGEADAGVVYASDAASTASIRVITRIDPRLHDPIEYPLLLLNGARPDARGLFDFLVSARGRAHFHDRGFIDAGR